MGNVGRTGYFGGRFLKNQPFFVGLYHSVIGSIELKMDMMVFATYSGETNLLIASASPTPDMLVTTYLEMTDPAQFRPAYIHDSRMEIKRLERVDVGFYLFLYTEVGWEFGWRDRLLMSHDELRQILAAATTSVYVLYYEGVPAGYVELARQDGSTEIIYFGLRAGFMGIGLGKHLLSFGIEQAWKDGAQRIFVHTCNLDGPHAMNNYLKRGFSVYHTEQKPMPDRYIQ